VSAYRSYAGFSVSVPADRVNGRGEGEQVEINEFASNSCLAADCRISKA